MDTFRASVGAAACGMAAARSTKACGMQSRASNLAGPLAEHQLIQEKLADMIRSSMPRGLLGLFAPHTLKDTAVHAHYSRAKRGKTLRNRSSLPDYR